MNIGVFDSGLGGLWILKYLEEELPGYNYIYFADQAHLPYGLREPSDIVELSSGITDFLLAKECKLIVLACNTATSAAIATLREKYSVPFVGIEPAIKPASEQSKTGHIGVLATKVTAEGKKLEDSIEKFAANVEVHTMIGNGLVELVEEGKADTHEAEALLQTYLEPLLVKNIDQLVLGCTHYAFLINRIKKIVGDKVHIVDPAPAVVKRVKQLLKNDSSVARTVLPTNKKGSEILTSGPNKEKIETFYKSIKLPNIGI